MNNHNLEWLQEAVMRDTDECIEWPFYQMRKGYGQITIKNRNRLVSHVALELVGRKWHPPWGSYALHSCDNPPCCNTRHLRWGTSARNTADMLERERESRGERHGKLTEKQVREMFVLRRQGWTQLRIAGRFGVHQVQVSRILLRKDWKHLEICA